MPRTWRPQETPCGQPFAYLIARGHKMHEHALQQAQAQDAAARQYIQSAVASQPGTADELARLADLKASGAIDEAEFQQAKAKALGSAPS